MALNIKDRETDRLARELSELTGESITDAVKAALREQLEKERRRKGKTVDRQSIDAARAAMAALPDVDARTPDELVGYDDWGLPR